MAQYLAGYQFPVASVARWVLKSVEDVFAEAGTELPDRRILTVGSVAVDSPLLAIMFGGLVVGVPGSELSAPMQAESPVTALFNIELWRAQPTLGPSGLIPTEAEESKASEVVMHDSWLLGMAAGRCDQMMTGVIWRVGVNEPQGGMVGTSLTLELLVP